MNRTARVLTERLGVCGTWSSVARITAWAAFATLAISAIVAPRAPTAADREFAPDIPESRNVRYVGPTSHRDFSGFLPPPRDEQAFTVAWIGGSEVKLNEVSVPGEMSLLVESVGDRPLVVDAYSVIAPRLVDVTRAVETASASGVDAIVIALNPAWVRSEWSMRGWPNLDVSNPTTLLRRSSTWPWALGLTSPADLAWRTGRELVAIVEAQARLNRSARDELDRLDILRDPVEPAAPDLDPRLPDDETGFWLVREHGPDILTDEDARVQAIMDGVIDDQDEARFFASVLFDELADAGVPVFAYATAYSAESMQDPEFAAAADRVEAFWRDVGAELDGPLIELEQRALTRTFASEGLFYDTVHMRDAGPFAAVLRDRLCAQWASHDPTWECT